MTKLLFRNNASGTLAADMTAIATTFTLGVGEGNGFPNPGSNQSFMITAQNGASIEIMEVTGRAGDVFTVARAQEGTTAGVWATGTPIEMRLTAGVMDRFFQLLAETVDFAKTLALGTTGKITGGTVENSTLNTCTIVSPNLKTASVKPVDGNTANAIGLPNGGGMPTIAGNKILTQAGDAEITGPLKTLSDVQGATGTFGSLTFKTGTLLQGVMTVDATATVIGNEADVDIIFKTAGVERIHFESTSKYLGIGTTTPSVAIHYYKAAAEALAMRLQNNAGTVDMALALDGTASLVWGAFPFKLMQNGQERMSMGTDGRVTASNSTGFNGNATGIRYVGTADPSGGVDGDIWLKV